MKKFKKSPIAIACYVFSAVFFAYFAATEVNTISTIYDYYAPYGVSPTFGEIAGYTIQQGISSLTSAILTCMAGIILEEVRKLNPANWATDDEIAEQKEAKKMAREAKQIAKGEAAKAAAEGAKDNDEEIKAEFAAVVAEESDGTVVFDEEDTSEESDTAAEVIEVPAEKSEAPETTEEYSDVFSAEVAEDVDEELAAQLNKAVSEAEAK